MNYNYVIFGSEWDLYRIAYNDLNGTDYAKYLWRHIDTESWLINFLYRFHTSAKVNNIIHLPFQNAWDKWQFRGKFDNDNPICFIFFSNRKQIINKRFFYYLRNKYDNCKLVMYCQDLISRSLKDTFFEMQNEFDLALTYDSGEAEKYKLEHYPLVYSHHQIPKGKNVEHCDVYFLGAAKNRLNKIIQTYEMLTKAGLKCDFYITAVNREEWRYPESIHYIDEMPYVENLQHVNESEYLLEILQEGAVGYTMRCCEAIMYDKRLITDNISVMDEPFYDKSRIICFDDANDLDVRYIADHKGAVDHEYKDDLSPIKLLEFIDDRLN